MFIGLLPFEDAAISTIFIIIWTLNGYKEKQKKKKWVCGFSIIFYDGHMSLPMINVVLNLRTFLRSQTNLSSTKNQKKNKQLISNGLKIARIFWKLHHAFERSISQM